MARDRVKLGGFLSVGFILAAVLFQFHGILNGNSTIIYDDIALYFYPLKVASAESLKRLAIPLWTTELQSGFPLLADSQAATFYPLETIPHLVFPHLVAHNLVIILQAFLAGLFMYLFVRRIGASHLASLFSAIIYLFAGPIFHFAGTPRLATALWWPLLLLMAEHITKSETLGQKLVYGSATAVVIALELLAGFIQLALFGLMASSFYLIFHAFARVPRPRDAIKFVVLWASATMAGLAIAAVQLIPTFELAQFSVRASDAEGQLATSGSLFPLGIAAFLAPNWSFLGALGSEGQNMYVGLLALVVSFTTLLGAKNRFIVFFWILFTVSLVLALGAYTPIYKALLSLPGFGYFRIPSRFVYLAVFSLALLAGIGLDKLFAQHENMASTMRIHKFAVRALVILAAFIPLAHLAGWAVLRLGKERLLSLAELYVNTRIYGSTYHTQGWEYYQDKVARLFAVAEKATSLTSGGLYVPLLAGLVGLLCFLAWRKGILTGTAAKAVVLTLTALELAFLQGFPQPIEAASVLSPPQTVAVLDKEAGPFRTYNLVTQEEIIAGGVNYEKLPANYNLLFDIPTVGVYSALGLKRYYELLGSLGTVNLAFGLRPSSPAEVLGGLNLLSLLNVKYVLSDTEIKDTRLTPLGSSGTKVYVNGYVLPRTLIVPAFKVMTEADDIVSTLRKADFDPRRYIVLEMAPAIALTELTATTTSTAAIVGYGPQRVLIEADLDGSGFLLLTDLYYPGWRAYVDGTEAEIYVADFVFRALFLPAGHHRIEFVYEPLSFRVGAAISLMALLATGIVAITSLVLIGRQFS